MSKKAAKKISLWLQEQNVFLAAMRKRGNVYVHYRVCFSLNKMCRKSTNQKRLIVIQDEDLLTGHFAIHSTNLVFMKKGIAETMPLFFKC